MTQCKADVVIYMDGKPEMEWRCEKEAGHDGGHSDNRYGWTACE
jgi:hypothetical protein